MKWLAAPALAGLLASAWPASAQTLPKLTAAVNDLAGVIDAVSEADLDRRIRALVASTGDVVVVATVDTIEPFGTIEEYAVRMFEQSGIGQRKTDSGALILLAVKERRVRIEVGYGLEEFITDGYAGETIREYMLPAFRQGDYGTGLVNGTSRVISRIAERRGVTLPDAAPAPSRARERSSSGISPALIVMIIIVVAQLLRLFTGFGGPTSTIGRRRRGGTWSGWTGGFGGGGFGGGGFGGGGGGGFGGFGGGRSGGGGASGGW